jgi:cation diffusion facilitator CzcD-associated flavoprotein CzcO
MDIKQNGHAVNDCLTTTDVVIVGAGFSGLFMLHHLREHGFKAKLFEAGGQVGGTWYWNCYPGARCDIESMQYSYSFSDELQQNWTWSERYASQPEILRYLNHVADKFDLRKDIQLDTRVTSAVFDESLLCWKIETDRNDRVSAKFCIMATGCLSVPKTPDIKGLDRFKGNIYSTSQWPHENISFAGRRVAVIGTGASGIQCIPVITEQASHVYVFQRTPNYCIPVNNGPLDSKEEQYWKSNYSQLRSAMLQTEGGLLSNGHQHCSALSVTPEERQKIYELAWDKGINAFLQPFTDIYYGEEANETVANFVRSKIRESVKDPTIAETLVPYNHPFGAKRLCIDNGYLDTFNRDNITLVDLRNGGIDEITPTAIKVGDKSYEVDDIVLALGFDAFTGALLKIDIRGRGNKTLQEKWAAGPRTYVGIMIADFPNLFLITGPGSPSEKINMVPHIEEHVRWITKCLQHIRTHSNNSIEPMVEAEDAWVKHIKEIADRKIFGKTSSLYNGGNIPGKPRVFIPYVGGFNNYLQICEGIARNNYDGFRFT